MSGQKIRLLSDLMTISQIKPGQTLVVDTMTIITYSWSTSLWRTLNLGKENRWRTIEHISKIMTESLQSLQEELDLQLYNYIELALEGINNLKETYSSDYYLSGDIAKLIRNVKNQLAEITKPEPPPSKELASKDPSSNELVSNELVSNELASNELASKELASKECEGEVMEDKIPDELEKAVQRHLEELDKKIPEKLEKPGNQKIRPDTISEGERRSEGESSSETMVTTSDRESSEEAIKGEVIDDSASIDREDNTSLTTCVSDSINKESVLSASDSGFKKSIDESSVGPVRQRRIWHKRAK